MPKDAAKKRSWRLSLPAHLGNALLLFIPGVAVGLFEL